MFHRDGFMGNSLRIRQDLKRNLGLTGGEPEREPKARLEPQLFFYGWRIISGIPLF